MRPELRPFRAAGCVARDREWGTALSEVERTPPDRGIAESSSGLLQEH